MKRLSFSAQVLLVGSIWLCLAMWSGLVYAGTTLFHTKPQQPISKGVRVLDVAPLIKQAKAAVFAVSYERSYSQRYRRYRRRMRRRYRGFRRRFRRRNPGWAPSPGGRNWLAPNPFRRRPSRSRRIKRGTGFVITAEGYALTRYLRNVTKIKAHFPGGRTLEAKLVGQSSVLGLSLLKLSTKTKLSYLAFGSSAKAEIGEATVVLGFHPKRGLSASAGILSGKVTTSRRGRLLYTDARVRWTQYGGPVLNSKGQVLAMVSNSRRLLPSDVITKKIPDLAKPGSDDGTIAKKPSLPVDKRAKLGVTISPVSGYTMRMFNLSSTRGALVREVMTGSAADKAGIKPGDVIIRFDGKAIITMRQLPLMVAAKPAGSQVEIKLIRSSKIVTLSATLGGWTGSGKAKKAAPSTPSSKPTSRPASPKAPAAPKTPSAPKAPAAPKAPKAAKKAPEDALSRLGLSVRSLNKAERTRLGIKSGGLMITSVKVGGTAGQNGISKGDVIVEVNRKSVTSVLHFLNTLNKVPKGETVLFLVRRGNTALFMAFPLP